MSDKHNPEFQKYPTDQAVWKQFWKDYCHNYGHKFVNGICIYCNVCRKDIDILGKT